jgi:hypothetical protein
MGLRFPPKVEPLPRQARSTVADANRLTIRLADASPSWWLLHELAHAMTSTHDSFSDGHGAKFMGVYAQLLTRYLRIPTDVLLESLHTAGIEVDMQAEPVFIDDPHPARASASSAAYSISSSRRDQHNKYRQADAELVDVNRSPDHRTHSLRWTTTTSNSCRSMTSGALAFMACRASPIASMLSDSALLGIGEKRPRPARPAM